MKIGMIGVGYVGLVTGACLSHMGNDVICMDSNVSKIEGLRKNLIPFFEPGLEELVRMNQKEERLSFTTDIRETVQKSGKIHLERSARLFKIRE